MDRTDSAKTIISPPSTWLLGTDKLLKGLNVKIVTPDNSIGLKKRHY